MPVPPSYPLFLALGATISSVMSIQSVYRRMPVYVAVPLVLLASAVVAATLAVLGAEPLDLLLEKLFRRPGDLGLGLLVWFCAVPSIAVLSFVFCFSVLINWYHPTSWRAPTFAFALGATSIWLWGRDFGGVGFGWYIPGIIAWLVSCWLVHRSASTHLKHVIEA